MKLQSLLEAKTAVVKREELSKLLSDMSVDKIIEALSRVMTSTQIDRLVDALGLGQTEDEIEFNFKMLLKGIPSELKPEIAEDFVSRKHWRVKAVKGHMDLWAAKRGNSQRRPMTAEEWKVYYLGRIWFSVYYLDGAWRTTYEYVDVKTGKNVIVKNEKMQPTQLLALMKKQVSDQLAAFDKAYDEMMELKRIRREKFAARKAAK